jgi:hypothetical protein
MDIQPLHTKIDKTIQTTRGYIVLEDPSGFPQKESNLYHIAGDRTIIWKAEKPDPYTLYSRMRIGDDGLTLSTYTLGGHACDIDLQSGKILNKTSIQ